MTNEESLKQCRDGVMNLVTRGLSPVDAIEHYFRCAYLNGYGAAMIELQNERWAREESERVRQEGVLSSTPAEAAHIGNDRGTGDA